MPGPHVDPSVWSPSLCIIPAPSLQGPEKPEVALAVRGHEQGVPADATQMQPLPHYQPTPSPVPLGGFLKNDIVVWGTRGKGA